MIELKDINYTYNPKSPFKAQALSNINLKVEQGEFVGLIGPTGSGKTTLCHIIAGLLKPTAGVYSAYDRVSPKASWLKGKVGLVFQYPEHQLFEETVYKDIAFGPGNLGLDADKIEQCVTDAAKLVGLSDDILKKSPFELSGGQKRRVAIAGVLAMNPDLLILDEPAAGLDPQGRIEILGQIKKLHKSLGTTVILVSHSMEDIAGLSERIIVMNAGGIYMDGGVEDVFGNCDRLLKIGLNLPQISLLALELGRNGIDIGKNIFTVEAARNAIISLYGGKNA